MACQSVLLTPYLVLVAIFVKRFYSVHYYIIEGYKASPTSFQSLDWI